MDCPTSTAGATAQYAEDYTAATVGIDAAYHQLSNMLVRICDHSTVVDNEAWECLHDIISKSFGASAFATQLVLWTEQLHAGLVTGVRQCAASPLPYIQALFGVSLTGPAAIAPTKLRDTMHAQLQTVMNLCAMLVPFIRLFPDLASPGLTQFLQDRSRMYRRIIVHLHDLLEKHVHCAQLVMAEETTDLPVSAQFTELADLEEQMSPVHVVMLYVLNRLKVYGFKRFENQCFEQRYVELPNAAGEMVSLPSRSWHEVCTIEEFVHEVCDKETHPQEWLHLLNTPNMASRIRDRLMMADEAEFPELKPNRHLFSFRNGLLDISKCSVTSYFGLAKMGPNESSVNFLDVDLPESFLGADLTQEQLMHEMCNMRTSTLDRLFEYQLEHEFDKDDDVLAAPPEQRAKLIRDKIDTVIRWAYVFYGRMFFEMHVHDKWQVVPFFKGVAGTGKSTLGKLLEDIFPMHLIGNLSSNCEKQFGLQSLLKKYAWVCYEVKSNFQLPLSELQSMISGEQVQVAVKNMSAVAVKWKAPGMMFGNEVPPWKDCAGALLRRFVMFKFDRPVPAHMVNTNMSEELYAELGCILPKVAAIYRSTMEQMGQRDVWQVLPQYFQKTRRSFLSSLDTFAAFISTSGLVVPSSDVDAFMLEDDFIKLLDEWCEKNKRQRPPWSEDTYSTAFQSYKMGVEVRDVALNGVHTQGARLITGVRAA